MWKHNNNEIEIPLPIQLIAYGESTLRIPVKHSSTIVMNATETQILLLFNNILNSVE